MQRVQSIMEAFRNDGRISIVAPPQLMYTFSPADAKLHPLTQLNVTESNLLSMSILWNVTDMIPGFEDKWTAIVGASFWARSNRQVWHQIIHAAPRILAHMEKLQGECLRDCQLDGVEVLLPTAAGFTGLVKPASEVVDDHPPNFSPSLFRTPQKKPRPFGRNELTSLTLKAGSGMVALA